MQPDRHETASPHAGRRGALRAVVAIPVCNEEERIAACLTAIDAQDGLAPGDLGILLFLNNCTDGTAEAVEALRPHLRCELLVRLQDHAEATAGWARREAMEAAAAWLDAAGATEAAILTTDADSRVPADWVSANLAALAAGADAVAGQIALDSGEAARLPDALHARGRLEGTYEALLTELEALIDPLPHDPWPRHRTTSGATLAVRLATYRAVGGLPALAVGEDRAFVSVLLGSGARVRHDPAIVVVTSGRLEGRAPGGAADTMRLRCAVPESPCDARLEPLGRALLRYVVRRHLRRLHASHRADRGGLWAPLLGVPRAAAEAILQLPTPALVFAAVEAVSPRLADAPLRPRQLPLRIGGARLLLVAVRTAAKLRRALRARRPAGPIVPVAATDRPNHV
ncbi:glycosyltransferase [Methylobacterium sp. A54F]